jgi:hypothetical protein
MLAPRLPRPASAMAAAAPVVDETLARAGQFLMVSGDAGIGKTTVLRALLDAAGPATLSTVTAADAQFRLLESVFRAVQTLAARRPLLVVLDDLQWSDEPSLRLLGFLARTLATSRVLLLGAYRDGKASDQLRELAGRAQQLPLKALDPDVAASVSNQMCPRPTATSAPR